VAEQEREGQLIEAIKVHSFLSKVQLPQLLTLYGVMADACWVYLILEPSHSAFSQTILQTAEPNRRRVCMEEAVVADHALTLLTLLK
jgi:hypothetical protein